MDRMYELYEIYEYIKRFESLGLIEWCKDRTINKIYKPEI